MDFPFRGRDSRRQQARSIAQPVNAAVPLMMSPSVCVLYGLRQLGVQHKLAARGTGVVGGDRTFDAELVRRRDLPLRMDSTSVASKE